MDAKYILENIAIARKQAALDEQRWKADGIKTEQAIVNLVNTVGRMLSNPAITLTCRVMILVSSGEIIERLLKEMEGN